MVNFLTLNCMNFLILQKEKVALGSPPEHNDFSPRDLL